MVRTGGSQPSNRGSIPRGGTLINIRVSRAYASDPGEYQGDPRTRYMKYFIINIFLLILAMPVLAYNCPFGYVNTPYPGHCNLYIDQNNNNLCDNSQNLDALEIKYAQTNDISQSKTNYYIGQIILIFIIFQLTGISLIQYNKINKLQWRKINNYGLLISFIFIFITSLIFLINLTNIWQIQNLRTINWLHIESGLIMILFSLEHLARRWQHYLNF